MNEPPNERLFEAWSEAAERSMPQLDDAAIKRRLLAAQAAPQRSGLATHYGLALACAAALAVALVFWLRQPTPTTFQVAGQTGRVGAWLTAGATEQLPLSFSEGTRVSLGAGSRGRVSQISARGARIELERGAVRAKVSHLPGAEWTFGAGPFEVTVLGTELDVSWSPDSGKFELAVASGRVLLRGPLVPTPQEVQAGQVCRIDLTRRLLELGRKTGAAASEETPEATATPPASAAAQPAASAEAAPSPSVATEPSWLALAQSGKHREALSAAERAGLSSIYRGASAESLLELASTARLAGRPEVERAALLACRKRAPGQAPAGQAAYLLGRASGPAEAASWFETYLGEQPSGLLAREASGRLIESYLAVGDSGAAARAASRYLAAYPHGPHASMARRTLGARSESQD